VANDSVPVRVWEYLDEYRAEREEILAVVDSVFSSGQLILGDRVREFEAAFAAYCGVRSGVGVSNATTGLALALRAAGIESGDEVITVANTAVPTVSAIVAAGGTPRFVDVDPATYLMDVRQVEGAVTPRTRFILPVHLYGQSVPVEELQAVADAHGLAVIEDCAQAHGAERHGRRVGSLGRAGVFSFYPTKPLGGYGDGGIVVTDDAVIESRLRRLRYYGMERQYLAVEDGYNSRLDEVQAAILTKKLARLDQYLRRRRELASRYDAALAGSGLTLPVTLAGNVHSYYLYVVRHPERERLLHRLRERGIELTVSYPWPIHTMPAYRRLGYSEGDLPVTEAASREIFSLPLYPSLPEATQDRVCEALLEALGSG
jgi:dTDP-3-amino-2,3,6-trideoxy-4-keto-D-glucose/dTDP-3-amino-3,4,6-trideoxy-alpha-D-glucose/dTDP-2,6-dideoxy-D-kanosamine transaminase